MTAPLRVTKGRRVALAIGLPVVLALIGYTGLTEVALAGQASYPVRLAVPVHGSTVRLSAGSADVRVTQAAGGELRLTGTAHYSLIRSTVTWYRTPSGVVVSPRCHFVAGVCSFDLHAIVPEGKRALISTGSGNVTLAGLSGPVSAGTGSGDVTLTFTKVPAQVHVSTGSGNVTLVLPPGNTAYRVNATTDSGNSVVHVPTSLVSQHRITVTTGSGNISITN